MINDSETLGVPETPGDATALGRERHPEVPPDARAAQQQFWWPIIVVAALITVSYLTEWWLPRRTSISPEVEIYVLRPLLWIGLAALATAAWFHLSDRPSFQWILPAAGLLVGLFHVSMLIIAGLISGFGNTPSLVSWTDYPLTVTSLAAVIIGTETTRASLAIAWKAISRQTSFVIITVLVFIAGTPINLFTGLDSAEQLFRIGGGRLAPALALSGALTWMAARGGPSPAIAYSGVLAAFWWFSPILPDLSWAAALVLGGIVPLISVRLVNSIVDDALKVPATPPEHDRARSRWPGWVVAGVVGLLTVGLFVGVFGVRLFVVTGISMEPTINAGDLVLVWERTDVADLSIGDIVKVAGRGHPVVHRIISIGTDETGTVLVTQGDNVGRPDAPVQPAEIDGKVVIAIPWIGRPALWLRGP